MTGESGQDGRRFAVLVPPQLAEDRAALVAFVRTEAAAQGFALPEEFAYTSSVLQPVEFEGRPVPWPDGRGGTYDPLPVVRVEVDLDGQGPSDPMLLAPSNNTWWALSGCPSWCVGEHGDPDEEPDDRHHYSERVEVALVHEAAHSVGHGMYRRETASVYLTQRYRDAEPVVTVDKGDRPAFTFALGEATQFASALLAAVACSTK